MAVKFASAFGAEVTVLSGSVGKEKSAIALGTKHFINTQDQKQIKSVTSGFDFLIDTVSALHDDNTYLQLIKKNGTMILLGVRQRPQLAAFMLIAKRRNIAGSTIGGIRETQEMLDFCAANNITADVEVVNPDYINQAFERTLKGDAKYHFVIDMAGLKK